MIFNARDTHNIQMLTMNGAVGAKVLVMSLARATSASR
jgi:hypothetical protein